MKSESIKEIAGALCKFQSQLKPVKRESENPFFKSKYADLAGIWDAIREPLSKNGLSVVQGTKVDGEGATIETTVLHVSGEWISGELPVFVKDYSSPQSLGSGITYARRYALAAILGISTEDDDGESAEGRREDVMTKAQQALSRADDLDKIEKLREWFLRQTVAPKAADVFLKQLEDKENGLRAKG